MHSTLYHFFTCFTINIDQANYYQSLNILFYNKGSSELRSFLQFGMLVLLLVALFILLGGFKGPVFASKVSMKFSIMRDK